MKYKLIASDMDGTLLNDDSVITERNKQAIIKAENAGVMFVTATGRPFTNTVVINEILTKDVPFIVLNGAEVHMAKSNELLLERFLDYDLAIEAFALGQELGIAQIVWTGPYLWANRICDKTTGYESRSSERIRSAITDLATIKDKVKGVSKVLWIDDPERIEMLSVEMSAHFGERLTCASSMSHFLEFIGSNAGKGSALKEVGKLFGIDRSEIIAIGDNYNDVCMLEYAGFSVAVDNAVDGVKAVADYVTVSNNNDAVAEVIERFVL
ncbi:MAG: Cof-type HAD-IIB family hydrolase [Oscillospiraceae bacterium]|nr:Cof-type HAD-IIB family hydrolase [Oscillospiraceae bacterium]